MIGLSAAWSFYNTEGFEFTVFERSKKCGVSQLF